MSEHEPEAHADDAGASAPEAAPTASRRADPTFLRELAGRLPAPGYSTWSVGENLSVEEDLRAVIDLRAQPLLEVIERLSQRSPT